MWDLCYSLCVTGSWAGTGSAAWRVWRSTGCTPCARWRCSATAWAAWWTEPSGASAIWKSCKQAHRGTPRLHPTFRRDFVGIKPHFVFVWARRQLDYNNLTEVNKGWLYGLLTLQQLHLTHNAISRIRPDAWEFCQKLAELWVQTVHPRPPTPPVPSTRPLSLPSLHSHTLNCQHFTVSPSPPLQQSRPAFLTLQFPRVQTPHKNKHTQTHT